MSCDSDSDDSYFDRLEQNALKNDDEMPDFEEKTITLISQDNYDNEEKYFQDLANSSKVEDKFVEEDGLIWQTIVKQNILEMKQNSTKTIGPYLVTRDDSAAIMQLKQWLSSELPRSCKLLGHVVALSSLNSNILLYTDNLINPSIVICFCESHEPGYYIDIHVFSSQRSWSSEISHQIGLLIHDTINKFQIKSSEEKVILCFCGIELDLIDRLSICLSWTSPCSLYTLDSIPKSKNLIPSDFELVNLW